MPSTRAFAAVILAALPLMAAPLPFLPPEAAGAAPAAPGPAAEASSMEGPLGLVRLVSARPGRAGEMRLGLSGFYLQSGTFPVPDVALRQGAARLMVSYSIDENWEVYGALRSHATSSPATVPGLVQAQGDIFIGGRSAWSLPHGFHGAGDARLLVPAGTGGVLPAFTAPALTLRGAGSWDVRSVARNLPLPVEILGNLGLTLDRTGALAPDQLSPAADFAMGLIRYPHLSFGVGAITRLQAFMPFLELGAVVPLGVGAEALAEATRPVSGTLGVTAFRATPGVRWAGPAGLSVTAAIEVGLGRRTAIPGFASAPPAAFFLAVGWATDPAGRVVQVEMPAAPAPEFDPLALPLPELEPAPLPGRVAGRVLVEGEPVAGAVVSFSAGLPVATDADGGFVSHELPEGPVRLEVSAPGLVSAAVETAVTSGGTGQVEIELQREPPAPKLASVVVAMLDAAGRPLQGRVRFEGAHPATLEADGRGLATLEGGAPGEYLITASAPEHLARAQRIVAEAGRPNATVILLHRRPEKPLVTFEEERRRLSLARKITFDPKTGELAAGTEAILDEVADVLLTRPDLARVVVEAHVERGPAGEEEAVALTQTQARQVADALVARGVPPHRLEAIGRGASMPVIPGKSLRAREKNRRVEFVPVALQ